VLPTIRPEATASGLPMLDQALLIVPEADLVSQYK